MSNKKRLLYLSNSYPLTVSGVSTVVNNLLDWMSKHYTVAVICPNTNARYLRQSNHNYSLYRLPSYPSPFRSDFRFITPNPLQVQKAFEDFQPDIVHLHDPSPASIVLKELALKQNIPAIFSHHFTSEMVLGYLPLTLKDIAQNNPQLNDSILEITCRLYEGATQLIVPSLTSLSSLSTHTNIPISVISSGVDYSKFHSQNQPLDNAISHKYHLPNKPFVFYLGRLAPEKNLNILLEAWAKLNSPQKYQLVIAGAGTSANLLKKLANNLNLDNSITWTGLVNQADLSSFYHHPYARVFVIPSPTESQSIVTLYALATGFPVVAADAGALPELVKNNLTGYLCPPNQVKCFASRIQYLLENPKEARKMGLAGSKIALQHNYPKIIKQYHALYAKALL